MSSVIHVQKRLVAGLVAVLAVASMAGPVLGEGQASGEAGATLATDRDRLSYAMGMDLGSQLRRSGVAIDAAIFGQALADALSGGKTRMTPDEARQEIGRLQVEMMRRQAAPEGQPGQAQGQGPAQAQPQSPAQAPRPARKTHPAASQ